MTDRELKWAIRQLVNYEVSKRQNTVFATTIVFDGIADTELTELLLKTFDLIEQYMDQNGIEDPAELNREELFKYVYEHIKGVRT